MSERLGRWSRRMERWADALSGQTFGSVAKALYRWLTLPFSVYFLTFGTRVHPAYGITVWRCARLALRFAWNAARIPSATSYKAHLVVATKLLELPPASECPGVVVECGCFKGAATANLSLVCQLVGRKLIVYDSFEGLPRPTGPDHWPPDIPWQPGMYKGTMDEVIANVRRYGAVDVCEFRKGWFRDTLPQHAEPVVTALVDVDYFSSLYDCVRGLWPHLVDGGYFFTDEYVLPDSCALFFSERFWRRYFDCDPPGLLGAGNGVQVGEYYVGPWWGAWAVWDPASVGFTRKGWRAIWTYYPDDPAAAEPPGQDAAQRPT